MPSRDYLLRFGWQDWEPWVLAGALEGLPGREYTDTEVDALIAEWISSPLYTGAPFGSADRPRAVVLKPSDRQIGDVPTWTGSRWEALAPGADGGGGDTGTGSGGMSPETYGAVAAVGVDDATVTVGSTSVSSSSGSFTSAMNGQKFYLRAAGAAQVTGVNAWEASPLVGTFTYVSASVGVMSVAASQAVTGRMYIGPDCTAAINAALAAGHCVLPSKKAFIVAGQIAYSGHGQILRGEGWATSMLLGVTAKGNGPIAALWDEVVAADFSWWGTAQGSQPATAQPSTSAAVVSALANAGCGVVFAAVKRGVMRGVRSFHCGGIGVGANTNGMSGLYSTMGCQDCRFENLQAHWCRNGFSEDSLLGGAAPTTYAPQRNSYLGIRGYHCRYGVVWDTGVNARDLAAVDVLGAACSQSGVEIHSTVGLHVVHPRGEGNALHGINVYGALDAFVCGR
jgi:hypothetical protein